ncbi:hypothetical protein CVIRNUC_002970 [Coccomyxa viridis]|uniref:Glycosyltransferase n=1 Tax=Coccomyxa viridis TaxID=1274662 RepID=A0AAV1I0Y5_9CHLO|nr:hypothetical protein CVIRNUC_002970 [Coccomyxa viridis]
MRSGAPLRHAENAIIVFVKYPTPGNVKTRIAADTGPLAASQLYKSCAEHTLRVACGCPGASVCVAYAFMNGGQVNDCVNDLQMRLWLDLIEDMQGCSYLQQAPDSDLGMRMADAICKTLGSGAQKVVFGPALDGGYYLVGMSRFPDKVFEEVQWSTPSVLQQSLDQAHAMGWSCAPVTSLPACQDLDTIWDVRAWMSRNRNHPLCIEFEEVLSSLLTSEQGLEPPCKPV